MDASSPRRGSMRLIPVSCWPLGSWKRYRSGRNRRARPSSNWPGCWWPGALAVAFSLDFGTHTSIQQGIAEEQLRSLPDYEHSPLFTAEERAVLRYADAMTRTPVWVPDDVFEALKTLDTDRQILEVTVAIAWENYHARVNHALDLEAEGVAERVCLVPGEGNCLRLLPAMCEREKHWGARGGPMPLEARVLTHEQARAFYDWMGAKQDWQAFYEERATRDLITHAAFETAQTVFEFGCGTGALAEGLLASHLPPEARYVAVDNSTIMHRLAQARLAHFGSRVTVERTDRSLQFEAASGSYDRFLSTDVVDLLSTSDIAVLLSEAHRLLTPEGYLCLVSLTHGTQGISCLVTTLWTGIHRLQPSLVGGCRPLELHALLPATCWHLEYVNTVTAFGIPSEIVVAQRQPDAREA